MILRTITIASIVMAALTLLSGSILAAVLVFIGSWLGLAGLVFVFLLAACKAVDQNKEQEEDDPFYRKLAGYMIEVLMRACSPWIRTSI